MLTTRKKSLLIIFQLCLFTFSFADGFITKDVYMFNSSKGTPVFTDKIPPKKQNYKVQTIEAAPSTARTSQRYIYTEPPTSVMERQPQRTQKVIVEHRFSQQKNTRKKPKKNRCKYYKGRFEYFSDRMNSGYKNSQYAYLEKNRVKYRDLLFNRCETRVDY